MLRPFDHLAIDSLLFIFEMEQGRIEQYRPWSVDLAAISNHHFVRVSEMVSTLHQLSQADYSIAANRRLLKERLGTIGRTVMSQRRRFPGEDVDGMVLYMDLDIPPISTFYNAIMAASDVNQAANTPVGQSRGTSSIGVDTSRDVAGDSQLSIHKNIAALRAATSDSTLLLTREVVEARHNIQWG